MSTATELHALLDTAHGLPYGLARSALVEQVVEGADALGDEALAQQARLDLVSCYSHGGEPLKRFAVFARLLARFDADPSGFGESAYRRLLWQFKWVTVGAVDHPGVPLDRIEQGLADMRRRYEDAGEGLAPYLGCRFQVDAHVHGHADAAAAYLAWVRAPRTALSDCRACEPSLRATHLAAVGRHDDAVREVLTVLRDAGCSDQPQDAISQVLTSLVHVADPERAAAEHLRGARLLRGTEGQTELWARHLHVLARSGHLSRGLDLLEDHLGVVDDPPHPAAGMWLAAAGARLLHALVDAGHGDVAVTVPRGSGGAGGGGGTVSRGHEGARTEPAREVADRLTRTARDLAARFDARNGTRAVGREVESWLDADELPPLPLDGLVSRRSLPPAPARPRAVPRDPARPGGPALDAAGLAARLEAGRVSQSVGPHLEVLREWRSRRDDLLPGAAPRDVARLDAALALHGVLEGGADAAVLHPALQSLREAGEHGAAARYELSALHLQVEGPEPPDGDALPGRLDALLAEADADAGDTVVVAVLGVLQAAARRGLLAPEVARARFTAELERGLRLLEAAAPDDLTPPRRGTLALLRVQDAARPLPAEARLERLRAAWSLLPAGMRAHERAVVGSELAPALAEARDLDGALAVLAEVVDDARTAADPGLAARALAMSARVHQHRGEHPAAVERLLQADRRLHEDLPALDPATRPAHPDPVEVAALRRDLALALQAAGRITEAAEVAETAVRGVEDHLAEQGVAPAPPPPDGDLADLVHGRAAPPEGGVPLDGPLVPAVRAAGTVSYVAATCCAELGERDRATSHALRSAAWHRLTGWRGAEAEALDLAGRAERDGDRALRLLLRAAAGYDEDGGRQEACRCRRQASGRAVELGLVSEALAVLDTLRTSLDSVPEGDVAAVAWERLALTEQSARVLAMAGRADEAFPLLDGLAEAYRELGDVGSVWDVALLRAESLAALDRAEEGLAELRAAAEEALTAGSPARARDLGGRLVDLLDDLGRPEEAEQAWSRYRGGAG